MNYKQNQAFEKRSRKFRLEHWHVITACLIVYDILAICASYFFALWIRFDCRFSMIPDEYLDPYFKFILVYAFFALVVFWKLHLYNSIWRFASFPSCSELFLLPGSHLCFILWE